MMEKMENSSLDLEHMELTQHLIKMVQLLERNHEVELELLELSLAQERTILARVHSIRGELSLVMQSETVGIQSRILQVLGNMHLMILWEEMAQSLLWEEDTICLIPSTLLDRGHTTVMSLEMDLNTRLGIDQRKSFEVMLLDQETMIQIITRQNQGLELLDLEQENELENIMKILLAQVSTPHQIEMKDLLIT